MSKKRFNSRARSNAPVEIDNSAIKEVRVEIEHKKSSYDESNTFVLPSQKRKTKIKQNKDQVVKLLSKKRRKQLEKVVENKKKKLKRASLLEELAKVQATEDELKQYTSITDIQTKGLKRLFQENKAIQQPKKIKKYFDHEATEEVVNAIKGSKKKRLAILENEIAENVSSDPNVVGFEESSESEDDSIESIDDSVIDKGENDSKNIPANSNQNKGLKVNHEDSNTKKKSFDEENAAKTPKANGNVPKTAICNNIVAKTVEVDKKPDKIRRKLLITEEDRQPAVFVAVNRSPEIQSARLKLPVLAEEQEIIEAIKHNSVVIITGETGSGKTTQVPQFLYEAGYAKNKIIGITEPRRVAAISMSKRVAEEMNLSTDQVSYLIRFEGNVTPNTRIKFMTDGVLLKEIQTDFLLTKYSVIILDEAHERSVFTDILIGLLSRIVPLRTKRKDPLKLVVMSATLRVEDFIDNPRLFKIKPPLVSVDSRQFPVTIHFNKITSDNYVLEAAKKAIKIHTRLPEGGILIFLTGQREVQTVVQKLRKRFPYRSPKKNNTKRVEKNKSDTDDEEFINVCRKLKLRKKSRGVELPKISLDNYQAIPDNEVEEDVVDNDVEDGDLQLDEDELDDEDIGFGDTSQPMWVLPLYSLLPASKQAQVFKPVPEGCRLCIVSTNVAETSLTIPNVKYVVDSGRVKCRLYDKITGVSTFRVCFTSQASANQRAGRAGRTGPGHCYRLYSSAVFNDQFEKFGEPEIRRRPVDDLLLQMKVMNIQKVVNFPFPTPPDVIQLKSAEKRLCILEALEPKSGVDSESEEESYNAKVTPLGYSISAFPVAPRFGKMLALSHQHDLIKYTICMVSAMSVQELLLENFGDGESNKKWLKIRRSWAGVGNSLLLGDIMVLIRAVGAAEFAESKGNIIKFCQDFGLRPKAVTEIRKLRQQLANEIMLNVPELDLSIDPNLPPPKDVDTKLLRQIVLAGMADQVAKKVNVDEMDDAENKEKWKHAYKTLEMDNPVFMHSSSVLRDSSPEWVVYQEIYETNKVYMGGVTVIEPKWLPKFVPTLCRMSDPLPEPSPRYDSTEGKIFCHVTGTFGRGAWELPPMEIEFPANIDGIRWFAKFFLEGLICPKLKKFVPSLLSTPSTVNKSWARLVPRTEAITKSLLSKEVMSKDKLLEVWGNDKTFLLSAYQKWIPESAHGEVTLLWPPF